MQYYKWIFSRAISAYKDKANSETFLWVIQLMEDNNCFSHYGLPDQSRYIWYSRLQSFIHNHLKWLCQSKKWQSSMLKNW